MLIVNNMNLTSLFSTRSSKWSTEDPDPYLLLLGPALVAQQVAEYVDHARSTANGSWVHRRGSKHVFPTTLPSRSKLHRIDGREKALLDHVFQQLETGFGSQRNPTIFIPLPCKH